jgi:hypothetical protein
MFNLIGRSSVKSLLIHLCFSLALSAAIMAVVFPQLYLDLDYSLVRFQDTEFLYYGLFVLAQNFSLGSFQLWNSYDQMPLAYFYLTGMVTYAHILTTAIYSFTVGITEHAGHYLFAVSLLIFNLIPAIIRTIGIYLAASLLTKNPIALLLSTILGSSLFNPQFHLGLNSTAIYSLLPLIFYFGLRFTHDYKIKFFSLAALTVVVAVSSNPLVGLGYFYQGVHFFLISLLIWVFLSQRKMKSR